MGPVGAKRCHTVPKRAIWAKQGQMGLNGVKWGQIGSNRANWAQTVQNGDKRGQLGQNLFRDGGHPRDGDHSTKIPLLILYLRVKSTYNISDAYLA